MAERVWLITGAGRGLGRAFTQEAVKHGDCVIAGVRKIPEGDDLFKHERVLPVRMDVTDAEQVAEAVKAGAEKFGRIDILINNAGFGLNGALEEITVEELQRLFATDYFGLVQVTRAHDTVKYIDENNHLQSGDPAKAAEAVYRIAVSDRMPKRLALGSACVAGYEEFLRSQLAELESYREMAAATDF